MGDARSDGGHTHMPVLLYAGTPIFLSVPFIYLFFHRRAPYYHRLARRFAWRARLYLA